MTEVWWVVLGAAVGAPLRHLIDRVLRDRIGSGFPWGILAANTLGCWVLGMVAGAEASPSSVLGIGIGFCGALTTYSSFASDTVHLATTGAWQTAAINVASNLTLGFAAFLVGIGCGSQL